MGLTAANPAASKGVSEPKKDLFITYFDTLILYFLHIDPKQMTTEEWVMRIVFLNKIRGEEAKLKTNI